MVGAIVILYLLTALLGAGVWAALQQASEAREHMKAVERWSVAMHRWLETQHAQIKGSHARLVDGLWDRASAEVDREIEKARARGRQD